MYKAEKAAESQADHEGRTRRQQRDNSTSQGCDRRRSILSKSVSSSAGQKLFIPPGYPMVVIESLCFKPLKSLHRTYPVRNRYTLQWLINPDPAISLSPIPNNIDAAFMTGSRKPKPSDLLLHYNYGSAAVKQWGHGVELLKNRANPPRPIPPVPALIGALNTFFKSSH